MGEDEGSFTVGSDNVKDKGGGRRDGGKRSGEVHLRFPVGLESVEGDIEERFPEMFAISSTKIVYCHIHRSTQFLDLIRGLCYQHMLCCNFTFLTLASSRISVGNPIDYNSDTISQ